MQLWVMMTLLPSLFIMSSYLFSNSIMEKKKKKHSESYIFPVISSTSCPWSISRTKKKRGPPPTPLLYTARILQHTQRLHSAGRLHHGTGVFHLHFTVCLRCKKVHLGGGGGGKKKKKDFPLSLLLIQTSYKFDL